MHLFVLDIEPCHSNPCENNGVCSKSGNSYNCACSAGYTGRRCESVYAGCIWKHFVCRLLTKPTRRYFISLISCLCVRVCVNVCLCCMCICVWSNCVSPHWWQHFINPNKQKG